VAELAFIGGTGLTSLAKLEITHREEVDTSFGKPSGPLTHGVWCGREVIFLARHGYDHTIPPHKVNYRANIQALKEAGVKSIVAVAAVGGITAAMGPGVIAIPDQIIDYTWGRGSTFFEDGLKEVVHIDFTHPYTPSLREKLLAAAQNSSQPVVDSGTYGATQGPRLETIAEIARMERDGCDLVGMTGMPEAALARELGIDYTAVAVVANWAAGKGDGGEITMEEIEITLKEGMQRVRALLEAAAPLV